jgi:8-oxo-dGTP pyrophosphatase MutT (NUDIX family)
MIEKISAGGVLYNPKNKKYYLIISLLKNEWNLPKGGVETGETLEQTALRELYEETGFKSLEFFVKDPIYTSKYIFEEKGQEYSKSVIYFLFTTLEETSAHTKEMDQENLSGAWFSYEEAIKKASFEDSKKGLKIAQEIFNQNL